MIYINVLLIAAIKSSLLGALSFSITSPAALSVINVDWTVTPYSCLNSISLSKSNLRIVLPAGKLAIAPEISLFSFTQTGHQSAWKYSTTGFWPSSES